MNKRKKLCSKVRAFNKKYNVIVMVNGNLQKAIVSCGSDENTLSIYSNEQRRHYAKNVKITDAFPYSVIAVRRRRGGKLLKSEDMFILKPLDILYI